jgi:hypothetical protein
MGMTTSDTKSQNPSVGPDSSPPECAAVTSPAMRLMTRVREIGGPSGPEPTRYGDWEKNGRCIDF